MWDYGFPTVVIILAVIGIAHSVHLDRKAKAAEHDLDLLWNNTMELRRELDSLWQTVKEDRASKPKQSLTTVWDVEQQAKHQGT